MAAFAGLPVMAEPLTAVPVHFLEALAPKDTTSSERFQKEYEGAIETAKALTSARLAHCGYQLSTRTHFYVASDALQAREGGQSAQKQKAWLVVGPRRSNHYLLMAQGAAKTPTISTMASSREIEELGPLHLSIAPSNAEMAKVAVSEVRVRLRTTKSLSYVSVVSEDCLACQDFSTQFESVAKKAGFAKLAEHRISGETPALTDIATAIGRSKPVVVLVPNLSKVAAQVIAAIQKTHSQAFFVGGDGWGDSRFGFVQNAASLEGTQGITVRGFPSADEGLKNFSLGRELLKSSNQSLPRPGSAVALAILKIIEDTAELLCERRPKGIAEFRSIFVSRKNYFRSPWGVSVYRLKDGDIAFEKIAVRSRAP